MGMNATDRHNRNVDHIISEKPSAFIIVESIPPLTEGETTRNKLYTRVVLEEVLGVLPSIAGEIGKVSELYANQGSSGYEIVRSLADGFFAKFSDGIVLFFDHKLAAETREVADSQTLQTSRFAWCWCPSAEKLSIKLEKIFTRIRNEQMMTPILVIIAKQPLQKLKHA